MGKSVPQHHNLSSFGKPRNAKLLVLGTDSLVMPKSDLRDVIFNPTLALMIDSDMLTLPLIHGGLFSNPRDNY